MSFNGKIQLAIPGSPSRRPFDSIRHAWQTAKAEGCALSYAAFYNRLTDHPGLSWAELTKPPSEAHAHKELRASRRQAKLEEGAAICAAIDARKAEMGRKP